ncbi:hypothetical protein ACU4GG_29755 [Streptomyces nojiriensis]
MDGELILYLERGGKTLLAWPEPSDARLEAALAALAAGSRAGTLPALTVERINAAASLTSPLGPALESAGFHATPRGLRMRS